LKIQGQLCQIWGFTRDSTALVITLTFESILVRYGIVINLVVKTCVLRVLQVFKKIFWAWTRRWLHRTATCTGCLWFVLTNHDIF